MNHGCRWRASWSRGDSRGWGSVNVVVVDKIVDEIGPERGLRDVLQLRPRLDASHVLRVAVVKARCPGGTGSATTKALLSWRAVPLNVGAVKAVDAATFAALASSSVSTTSTTTGACWLASAVEPGIIIGEVGAAVATSATRVLA